MGQDPTQALYDELTQICAEFSQRPQNHPDRLALLSFPHHQWVELQSILPEHSPLARRLRRAEAQGVTLHACHVDTPDEEWALINFYSAELSAIPATALLLKKVHSLPEGH